MLSALGNVVVFGASLFWFGAALAPAAGDALERFCRGIVAGLATTFAIGWIGFTLGAGNGATAATATALAITTFIVRRDRVLTLLRNTEVRCFLGAWLVFASWSLGLLALVVTYSGGGWAGDWLEHWERARFFLERQPLDTVFIGIYSLPARPPLVNVITALWLEGSARQFADFQVFTTLFGTLVLLPAWLLARRWMRPNFVGYMVVLVLMANPLVAQNLTFAWTKMTTAFFVLSAVYFVLVRIEFSADPTRRTAAFACAALGVLAHYSAVPWLLALLLATVIARRSGRDMLGGALAVAVVLAPWLVWSIIHYGFGGTVTSNSTAGAWRALSSIERIVVPAQNLFATLVPISLRGEPSDLIVQASWLGRLRDLAFSHYQLNLPLAFGLSGGWIMLQRAAQNYGQRVPPVRPSAPFPRVFFWILLPAAIVLGVAVHLQPDAWGLTHICLQPLCILGLAWIASELVKASPHHRIGWAIFAGVDFGLGIALHFSLQSHAARPWVSLSNEVASYLNALSQTARINAVAKEHFQLVFFADRLDAPAALIAFVLAGLLLLVIVRVQRAVAPID